MIKFDAEDRSAATARYGERYREFGYSPKALGWWGGRQDLRFAVLTSQYDFAGKHVLDVGCGFGDLNLTLRDRADNYRYTGIDLSAEFIAEAHKRYGSPDVQFAVAEFLEAVFVEPFDYIVESGIFNHRYVRNDNYEVIDACIGKALANCRDGLAFDFNSHTRPNQQPNIFFADPARILAIAQRPSSNVLLRHDYMPSEFTLFAWKDDSFLDEEKVYSRYKTVHGYVPQKA